MFLSLVLISLESTGLLFLSLMWKSREKPAQIPEPLSREVYQVIGALKQALQLVRSCRAVPASGSKSSKAERSERGVRTAHQKRDRDRDAAVPMPHQQSVPSGIGIGSGNGSVECDSLGVIGGGCEPMYLNAVRLLGLACLPSQPETTKDFKDMVEALFSFGLSAQLTAALSALASASSSLRRDIQVLSFSRNRFKNLLLLSYSASHSTRTSHSCVCMCFSRIPILE